MLVTSPLNPLGGAFADLWSFLSGALTSLALCPMSSSCAGLSTLGFFFFYEPSVMTGLHLGLSSLNRGLNTQGCKLVNQRAHLVFFSSLRDHSPSLPGVQCFANHCFIYFVLFFPGHFRWEGKSDSCYSILVRRRSFGYKELQIT